VKRTILVVDDQPSILVQVNEALRDDFDVRLVTSVADAMRILGSCSVTLIISDIMMPGTSGVDFAQMLSRNEALANIPIIFITSKATKNILDVAMQVGVSDFIVKPFSNDTLEQKVKSVLKRVRTQSARNADGALPGTIKKQMQMRAKERTIKGYLQNLLVNLQSGNFNEALRIARLMQNTEYSYACASKIEEIMFFISKINYKAAISIIETLINNPLPVD